MKMNWFKKSLLALEVLVLGVCASCSISPPKYPVPEYRNPGIENIEPEKPKPEQPKPKPKPEIPKPVEPKGYDNSSYKVSDKSIEQMLNSAYIVDVDAIYRHIETGVLRDLGGRGTGFIVKHDQKANGTLYFITCEHVVEIEPVILHPWTGQPIYEFVSLNGIYIIDDEDNKFEAKIASANKDTDIAVLTTEGDLSMWLKNYKPIKFTNEDIKPGDATYTVGYAYGRTDKLIKYINQGIISNIDSDQFFFESAAMNSGFSGGPVYVLKNGAPYIAGINEFYMIGMHDQFGAIKSEHAKKELEKVLEEEKKPKPKLPQTQPDQPEEPEKSKYEEEVFKYE